MASIQGMGSTKNTNRDQGGGPSKWAPPNSTGVRANLANVYLANSVPYNSMVNSMTITCRIQSVASNSSDSSAMTITFLINSLSFLPETGMAISSGSFIAIITNVFVDSGLVTAVVTYTLISGTPPSTNIATYTIKPAGCPG